MSNYSRTVAEAVSCVTMSLPFFASLLFDLMVIKEDNDKVPTAGTDDHTIWINTEWFGKMPVPQRAFVLCHEVMHSVFKHMARAKHYKSLGIGPDHKPFNSRKLNAAQDYVINAMLVEAKAGTMPAEGLIDPRFTGEMLSDDVYKLLPTSSNDAGGAGDGSGGFDYHFVPSQGQAGDELDKLDAKVERALRSAISSAKALGNLPGCIERVMGELLDPKVPWKDMLRNCVTNTLSRDETTWKRPNRRHICLAEPIIMPGPTGFAAGTVVVQVDTSGSVSADELTAFMSELASIFTESRPEELIILWVDAAVAGVERIQNAGDLPELKPKGFGGTDMCKGFDWVEKEGIIPDTFITFTDLYTGWPGSAPDYPVITVGTTKDHEGCPFGDNIYLDL